jgi:hypothetical protein
VVGRADLAAVMSEIRRSFGSEAGMMGA